MAAASDKTLWNEANKQLWREQGRMLTVLGHRLFVRDDGAADQPTILLIHGFPHPVGTGRVYGKGCARTTA